jgi:hypothetical protein
MYKMELNSSLVPSLAERIAKGYSLGRFETLTPVKPDGNVTEKENVPLVRIYGHLADEMKNLDAQLQRTALEIDQRSKDANQRELADLAVEAVRAKALLSGTRSAHTVEISRTWETFQACVNEVKRYVFEQKGSEPISGCLELIPENVLPKEFQLALHTNSKEMILFYQDLLSFTLQDYFWILPAFDRRFVGEFQVTARELWVTLRYLRKQGHDLQNSFSQVEKGLASFKVESGKIPDMNRAVYRLDFCRQWKSHFDEYQTEIEGTDLCKAS